MAHQATYSSKRASYGPGLAGFIDLGRALTALELQRVWLRRRAFAGRLAALFEGIDLLLIPGQPMASPTKAEMATLGVDPDSFARLVRFSVPFSARGVHGGAHTTGHSAGRQTSQ